MMPLSFTLRHFRAYFFLRHIFASSDASASHITLLHRHYARFIRLRFDMPRDMTFILMLPSAWCLRRLYFMMLMPLFRHMPQRRERRHTRRCARCRSCALFLLRFKICSPYADTIVVTRASMPKMLCALYACCASCA